jgi:Rad3-related DNA helicase
LSNDDKDKHKTHLRTFRLSESLERSLEKEAADEGTTVNADVNSILSQHFSWVKKAEEFGFYSIPIRLLRDILEKLDDEALAQLGREVLPALWKEMAEFFSQDSSLDGMVRFQAMRSKFNPHNETRVMLDGDVYTIVWRHDFGPKWSIVVKSAAQEFVRKSFHVEPRMNIGESVVTARFKVKP